MISRRAALTIPAAAGIAAARTPPQLRIGHRAASMRMVGNFDVFRLASRIDGLLGVELQIAAGEPNLWDLDAVRRYRREARRWGMRIPSLAGVWPKGVSINDSPAAGSLLMRAVRAAELLGARVVLVAFFRGNAPDMNDENSYGPVVETLRAAAKPAQDAGVVLGLENSLSPAHNARLVDFIAEENVKVYYDVHNMAFYGHRAEAVPGIALLGRERICQVHVKNDERLIAEQGPIDWKAALDAFRGIGYDGWYVFESRHSGTEQLIDATVKNIAFLRSRLTVRAKSAAGVRAPRRRGA